jgi:hypothetical protein
LQLLSRLPPESVQEKMMDTGLFRFIVDGKAWAGHRKGGESFLLESLKMPDSPEEIEAVLYLPA